MEIFAFVAFAALVLVWIVAPSTTRVTSSERHDVEVKVAA